MKAFHFGALLLLVAAVCACQETHEKAPTVTLYHGGDILTMEGEAATYVECVGVSEETGRIVFVGTLHEAQEQYPEHALENLDGNTLLPGFVDPHGHYASSLTVSQQAQVYPPPNGGGSHVDSIISILKLHQKEYNIPQDTSGLILAYGYDENQMEEQPLNRDLLDAAFPDNPVVVSHISMHGGVLNSLALKKYGFDSTYVPSENTMVQYQHPGTTQGLPYGLIMEDDYMQKVFAQLPAPTGSEEIKKATQAGQMMYTSEGITLAHEGATLLKDLQVMDLAAQDGANVIDVVAHPFLFDVNAIRKQFNDSLWGQYRNGLKIGAIKITVDGSPQGRTALFTEPYRPYDPTNQEYGTLVVPKEELDSAMRAIFERGFPLNVHVNGDSAIDLFLDAYRFARRLDDSSQANDSTPWNVTTIHTQFVRPDQLRKLLEHDIRPSFYTEHAFYFGETHIKNRGQDQAEFLSPLRAAIDMGMRPTNHTDFVVAPLDQMFVLWSAVTRTTRAGYNAYEEGRWDGTDADIPEGEIYVLGPDQRVSAYEGLLTQTLWAAEQYEEGHRRGSLAVGKLADFVILSDNPLKIAPAEIRNIEVLQTLKDGEIVYSAMEEPK